VYRSHLRKFLGILGIFLIIILCKIVLFRNPILEGFYSKYHENGLKMLSEIQMWEKNFGNPKTLEQRDGGNTFFYWSEQGVAVFTHPLYEGQYRRKERKDWKVTSIIIPLTKTIRSDFLSLNSGQLIYFENLSDIKVNGFFLSTYDLPKLKRLYLFSFKTKDGYIELVNIPFLSPILIRIYLENNKPAKIEIRENNIFSWYD
jgi:hypothetical protein